MSSLNPPFESSGQDQIQPSKLNENDVISNYRNTNPILSSRRNENIIHIRQSNVPVESEVCDAISGYLQWKYERELKEIITDQGKFRGYYIVFDESTRGRRCATNFVKSYNGGHCLNKLQHKLVLELFPSDYTKSLREGSTDADAGNKKKAIRNTNHSVADLDTVPTSKKAELQRNPPESLCTGVDSSQNFNVDLDAKTESIPTTRKEIDDVTVSEKTMPEITTRRLSSTAIQSQPRGSTVDLTHLPYSQVQLKNISNGFEKMRANNPFLARYLGFPICFIPSNRITMTAEGEDFLFSEFTTHSTLEPYFYHHSDERGCISFGLDPYWANWLHTSSLTNGKARKLSGLRRIW